MKNYANEITVDRKNLGLNQAEIAKKIGISQQSVAKWESGSEPRPKQFKKLLELLGEDSYTAKKYRGENTPSSKTSEELLAIAMRLLAEREDLIKELTRNKD